MRVLLTSHGSTGDIFPVIRLGCALLEAGHEVRFATVSFFRDEVERAGLEFVSLPPDWDQGGLAEAMRDLTKAKNAIDLIGIIYKESLPYIDEIFVILRAELAWADVFVSSYLFSSLCTLAQSMGVPSAVTTFTHNAVPSPSYPPERYPRLLFSPAVLRRAWNSFLWKMGDRLITWKINQIVADAAERNGIGRIQNFLLEPADRVIVTVSPGLFQPKTLWSERFVFSGYLRWQSPEDPAIEAELEEFCAGEKVPILTFGSVNFDEARKVMARFIRCWPKGKKLIVQSGWAGLAIERPRSEIKRVGTVSHDQLFRYGSLVIHHGGAGTTASVLYAGLPHIVIPHIGDQWFFAGEMKRLGVGLELKSSKWPENLPKAVRTVEKSRKMPLRAKSLRELLAKEDGSATAVQVIEELAESRDAEG
ncbi:MAG: glycosyltransferase [Coraliomargaritaceae bacterium]